jgi:hypothetical protein
MTAAPTPITERLAERLKRDDIYGVSMDRRQAERIAAALAPVVAALQAEARADALRDAADDPIWTLGEGNIDANTPSVTVPQVLRILADRHARESGNTTTHDDEEDA